MQSFSYRQKQECLDKAAVMITLLKPQFEQYRQVNIHSNKSKNIQKVHPPTL